MPHGYRPLENPAQQKKKQNVPKKLFQKGQSGNPSGRPKGAISPTSTLRRLLSEPDAEKMIRNIIELATNKPQAKSFQSKDGETVYEAIDGNEVKMYVWANDFIIERLDGKVTQPLSNPDGTPLVFATMLPGLKGKRNA